MRISAILVLFVLICAACNKKYSADQIRPYVMFGDGIAYGTGTSHQRFNLASCLGRKIGAYFENMGLPGDTSRGARQRLPGLLNANPRMVVISVGVNDLQQRIDPRETKDNLTEIFARLQKENIPVYYIDMSSSMFNPQSKTMGVARDNPLDGIEALVSEFPNVYFVKDVMSGLVQNRVKMFDEVHPNNFGYAEICDRVFKVIKASGQRSS